jgi:small subunit ribosomal protein S6
LNTYEAMFVMDSGMAADWQAVEGEIERLTGRAEAELLCCRKWDERRLAYEIGPHKRGCYVLTYLRADPTRIAGLERDAQLSEHILRMLVLRADHVSEEEIRNHAQAGAEQAAVMRGGEKPDEAERSQQDKPVAEEAKPARPDTQADTPEQEKPAAADFVPDSQAPAAPPATDQAPADEPPAGDSPGDANPEEPTPLS